MADNITAPAFGAALATDEIGSVHYPRTKIGHGADGVYADASAAAPLPVAVHGIGVTIADRSGAIAAGGTAQTLAAANAARRGLFVQNVSSGDLRVSARGGATGTAGLLLTPGALYEWPAHMTPTGAISVWGAATGQAFEAGEC